ncbi:MAG: hypothetical protein QOJ23_269 [Actinomycetota bacterium]|jgi:uncharacterized cupredoxin-like copper-binding protein|nr:hypothetical protein [Actinomycetota bacterium]MDQ1501053.1 hypothetical protein [Actinomycetota bacterium]
MRTPPHMFGSLFTVAVVAVAGACGGGSHHAGPAADKAGGVATRTVDVEMRDVAYSPTSIPVQAGETVRFVFHNNGQAVHDAFLGDEAAQAEHEKEMRSESSGSGSGGMGGMGGGHGDAGIKVEPGKTGELTHTFQKGQSVVIGCHEPGHYAAGMKLALTVS